MLERRLFDCRSRARSEIMAGKVLVNGVVCDKPGTFVRDEARITLSPGNPYVSRGGLKIAGAARDLGFNVRNKTVLDSGSSTGGFTDYALQNGALKVYAIDVGYGQLAWKLRNDKRVVVMERCNIRYLRREQLEDIPDLALLDLSFISLKKVLPALVDIGIQEIVALVKPQFEAGKEMVGKKGVVRDPLVHVRVLEDLLDFGRKAGLREAGVTFSHLKGPQGNLEYFIYWKLASLENLKPSTVHTDQVKETVARAFAHFAPKT